VLKFSVNIWVKVLDSPSEKTVFETHAFAVGFISKSPPVATFRSAVSAAQLVKVAGPHVRKSEQAWAVSCVGPRIKFVVLQVSAEAQRLNALMKATNKVFIRNILWVWVRFQDVMKKHSGGKGKRLLF
jgi:hypothetical protein